jgi:hypothetical protein
MTTEGMITTKLNITAAIIGAELLGLISGEGLGGAIPCGEGLGGAIPCGEGLGGVIPCDERLGGFLTFGERLGAIIGGSAGPEERTAIPSNGDLATAYTGPEEKTGMLLVNALHPIVFPVMDMSKNRCMNCVS